MVGSGLNRREYLECARKLQKNDVAAEVCGQLADKRAEQMLYEDLNKARPGYGFIGEEGGTREGADKRHTWTVETLDGTTNLLHAIPQVAVSV